LRLLVIFIFLKGFQGKTGPAGPLGIVGPQVSSLVSLDLSTLEFCVNNFCIRDLLEKLVHLEIVDTLDLKANLERMDYLDRLVKKELKVIVDLLDLQVVLDRLEFKDTLVKEASKDQLDQLV